MSHTQDLYLELPPEYRHRATMKTTPFIKLLGTSRESFFKMMQEGILPPPLPHEFTGCTQHHVWDVASVVVFLRKQRQAADDLRAAAVAADAAKATK